MLCELVAENIATIEKIDWNISNGFTVLTGETGAGKSILIDSLLMLLGEKTSRDMVRAGANKASAYGVFASVPDKAVKILEENGMAPEEDGNLIISREISADGRSNCRINGRPATVSLLKEIGRELVNIHGQHENQQMLNEDNHLGYLDGFANDNKLIEAYGDCYHGLVKLRREIKELTEKNEKISGKAEYYKNAVEEIKSLGLKIGEEDELLSMKKEAAAAEKISAVSEEGYNLLQGGERSACELLETVKKEVDTLSGTVSGFDEISSRLASVIAETKDIASELDKRSDGGFSMSLDDIENRLSVIHRLKLKYGVQTGDELIAFAEEAENRTSAIIGFEEELSALKEKFSERYRELEKAAENLSKERKKKAKELDEKIISELSYLDMKNVRFITEIKDTEKNGKRSFTERGGDAVRFLISANAGEEPKPLAKISSGGEISRLMLAVKAVLADCFTVPTLIFDEIDTGVSGATASKIGNRMKKISNGAQVICVTHLAQIAAKADDQFKVSKKSDNGRTYSELTHLNETERVDELARIIGGETITEAAKETARQMMKE